MYQQQVEIDLPFRVSPQGGIAFTRDPARQLRNRIISIIGTEVGSRAMRPDYGVPLASMLFESDDDLTTSIITSDIEAAIAAHEPGVIVQEVVADAAEAVDGIINVSVTYSSANSVDTVTLPINLATLYRGGAIEEERSG